MHLSCPALCLHQENLHRFLCYTTPPNPPRPGVEAASAVGRAGWPWLTGAAEDGIPGTDSLTRAEFTAHLARGGLRAASACVTL